MSWNIDIPWSLNCSDTFPRMKFENRAPTGCRPGPILSTSTISFELQAKVAEEIDVEMCSYGQLSEVQMFRDLDIDLGSGQGHVNIHSTYRITCMPNHVTVALCSTEIWQFEFRELSTFGEVWTLVIAFLEGNSKIGLRHAVDQVPYYQRQPSLLSSTLKWRRRQTWKCAVMSNCRKFKCSVTLTLDGVTVTSTYTVHVGLAACPTMWL